MAVERQPVPHRCDEGDHEERDEEAAARAAAPLPGEEHDDHEQRDADIGAALDVVPREVLGEAPAPPPAEGGLRREDEVEDVGGEVLGAGRRVRVVAARDVVEERRRHDRSEDVAAGERQERPAKLRARAGDEERGEEERRHERKGRREQDLGRDQHLGGEDRAHLERESAAARLILDEAEHHECGEREQEDGGAEDVRELCRHQVAREAEDPAGRKRRPGRSGEAAREQERGPGGERRHQDRGDVVGEDGPEEERERCEGERKPGDARRPRQVEPAGRPDLVGVDRVEPVQDRVRPPGERPDEDLRVGEEPADHVALRVRGDREPEKEERDGEVGRKRPAAATAGEARRDARDHRESLGANSATARRDGPGVRHRFLLGQPRGLTRRAEVV